MCVCVCAIQQKLFCWQVQNDGDISGSFKFECDNKTKGPSFGQIPQLFHKIVLYD